MKIGDWINSGEIKTELQLKAVIAIAQKHRIDTRYFDVPFNLCPTNQKIYVGLKDSRKVLLHKTCCEGWWNHASNLLDWLSVGFDSALRYSPDYRLFYYQSRLTKNNPRWISDEPCPDYKSEETDPIVAFETHQPELNKPTRYVTRRYPTASQIGILRQLGEYHVIEQDTLLSAYLPQDIVYLPLER